jgi:integrase
VLKPRSAAADAERAPWELLNRGQAEGGRDTRFRALVLLAAFASLRWGEVTALRRCDLVLDAGTVRVRAAFTERSRSSPMSSVCQYPQGTAVAHPFWHECGTDWLFGRSGRGAARSWN